MNMHRYLISNLSGMHVISGTEQVWLPINTRQIAPRLVERLFPVVHNVAPLYNIPCKNSGIFSVPVSHLEAYNDPLASSIPWKPSNFRWPCRFLSENRSMYILRVLFPFSYEWNACWQALHWYNETWCLKSLRRMTNQDIEVFLSTEFNSAISKRCFLRLHSYIKSCYLAAPLSAFIF